MSYTNLCFAPMLVILVSCHDIWKKSASSRAECVWRVTTDVVGGTINAGWALWRLWDGFFGKRKVVVEVDVDV
jgi:hypothetical protein